jgi:metal-responsive CopG/Arc/MetJ family transcriptional regulator
MEWIMIRRLTISLTIDKDLLRELENLRGNEKRSPFVERLVRRGLEKQKEDTSNPSDPKSLASPVQPTD